MLKNIVLACALASSAGLVNPAYADIVRISSGDFKPVAGTITFSEYPQGTQNPVYTPVQYGGNPLTAPTVSFGGFFTGQSLSSNPSTDCPGASASACVVGKPAAALSLDPNSPPTFITGDSAQTAPPILSGSPAYNGSIAVLFGSDQLAVGFDGGYFDAIGSTGIRAFDRNGNVLGTIANLTTGVEFLGIGTNDNIARIAGVELTLVGAEPFGFDIDTLRFGAPGEVTIPGTPVSTVPESQTWLMLIGGFGFVGSILRRRARVARTLLPA